MSFEKFYNDVAALKVVSVDPRAPIAPAKVIRSGAATVVLWDDGTKTVVRCQGGDAYDAREGFLLCCAKRLMGNTGAYNDVMGVVGVPECHSPRMAAQVLARYHGSEA